jgi:hypothetical protein
MAAPTVPFSEYAPKVATIKPDFAFRLAAGGSRPQNSRLLNHAREDGSGFRDCRIFGMLRPVRIVRSARW